MGQDELKDQAAEPGAQEKVGDTAGLDKVVDTPIAESGGQVDEGSPSADQDPSQ